MDFAVAMLFDFLVAFGDFLLDSTWLELAFSIREVRIPFFPSSRRFLYLYLV